MSDQNSVYTVLDYIKNKVDAALVHESNVQEFQIKYSENEIDVNKVWNYTDLAFFVAKDGKTIGASIPIPETEQDLKKTLDTYLKTLNKLTPSPLYKDIYEGKPEYKSFNESVYNDPKYEYIAEQMPDITNNAIEESIKNGGKRNAGIFLLGKRSRHLVSSKGPDAKITNTYYEFNMRALDEGTDHTGTGNTAGSILSKQSSEYKINQVGIQAGETSKKMNNAVKGTPGTFDVIFSPQVSSYVLSALPHQADFTSIMFGISGLKDKIGEQLAPDFVTITDNPTKEDSMVFNLFDMEGMATRETPIIENGILKNFIYNTSTGLIAGSPSTGNSFLSSSGGKMRVLSSGFHGLDFKNGTSTLDEMVSYSSKPVIYVQNTWYTRYTNRIEGIFSTIPRDGLFLIDNGIWKPIKKLRISDNLYKIMKNIQLVGNDSQCVKWWDEYGPEWFPHTRVENVTFSSATK